MSTQLRWQVGRQARLQATRGASGLLQGWRRQCTASDGVAPSLQAAATTLVNTVKAKRTQPTWPIVSSRTRVLMAGWAAGEAAAAAAGTLPVGRRGAADSAVGRSGLPPSMAASRGRRAGQGSDCGRHACAQNCKR